MLEKKLALAKANAVMGEKRDGKEIARAAKIALARNPAVNDANGR
jgi:hypothetical protein